MLSYGEWVTGSVWRCWECETQLATEELRPSQWTQHWGLTHGWIDKTVSQQCRDQERSDNREHPHYLLGLVTINYLLDVNMLAICWFKEDGFRYQFINMYTINGVVGRFVIIFISNAGSEVWSIVVCTHPCSMYLSSLYPSGMYPSDMYPCGIYPCGMYKYPCGMYQCGFYQCGMYPCGMYPCPPVHIEYWHWLGVEEPVLPLSLADSPPPKTSTVRPLQLFKVIRKS